MGINFGVFLDIDGCLTSSDGNVCLDYYQANSELATLVRKSRVGDGPSIRLCSSRDRNCVELMAKFFGMVNSWMIVEIGAALFNPTTHDEKPNPAVTPKAEKLFRWLRKKKLPVILERYKCLREYSGYKVCCSLEKRLGSSIDMQAICAFLEGSKSKDRPKRSKGLLTHLISKDRPKRSKGLLTHLIGKKLLKVERAGNFVDIVPAGVSKGTAAKFLMELEGWDPSWCIAIGDSESDFSFFRSVGRIGCPSNATPRCIEFVKAHHGKVSMYPYTRGVVDVINWYLGIEEQG